MVEALKRLNILEKMVNNIQFLYRKPLFRVVTDEETSEIRQQKPGIRQGCPLSTYLFILEMKVLIADIHDRINPISYPKLDEGVIGGLSFIELLYADVTLLALKDSKSATLLLHDIENESNYYNTKLNEDTCQCIAINHKDKIEFTNGKQMKYVEQVKHLEGILTRNTNDMLKSATPPTVRKL